MSMLLLLVVLLLLLAGVEELSVGFLGVAGHVVLAPEPLGAVGAAELTVPRMDHATETNKKNYEKG
jgi:hypothetical protein